MARRGIDFRIRTGVNTAGIERASRALALQARALKKAAMASAALNTNMARSSRLQKTGARATSKTNAALTDADRTTQALIKTKKKLSVVENKLAKTQKQLAQHIEKDTKKTKKATKQQRKLNRARSQGAAILQRLGTAMLIFGATHQVSRGFKSLVSTAIEFNKNLESARLGIAALITASGNVVDAQGQMVTTAEKFAWSQGEARRQVQLLRKDALATEATFTELMNIFQLGVTPGLTAGMDLDEIRTFTVRISQAASALQMPQRQLAEEIRSILQGTIRATSTRIATALTITNRQVNQWRAMGTLGKELQERFEAFAVAGDKLKDTLGGLTGRVNDAFQQLVGEAGKGFYETIKQGLADTFELLVTVGEKGIIVNEDLKQGLEYFFSALSDIIVYARRGAKALSMEGAVKSIRYVSDLIREIGKGIVDIVSGIRKGVDTVSSLYKGVTNISKELGLIDINLRPLLSLAIQITTIWASFAALLKFSRFTLSGIESILIAIKGLTSKIFKNFRMIISPAGLITSAVMGLATILNNVVSKELGVSADFVTQMGVGLRVAGDIAARIGKTLELGFTAAYQSLRVVMDAMMVGYYKITKAFLQAKYKLGFGGLETELAINELNRNIAQAQKRLSKTSAEGFNKIRDSFRETVKSWNTLGRDMGKTINQYWEDFERGGKKAGTLILNDLTNLLNSGVEAGQSFMDGLRQKIHEANNDPPEVKIKLNTGLDPKDMSRGDIPFEKATPAQIKAQAVADTDAYSIVNLKDLYTDSDLEKLETAEQKLVSLKNTLKDTKKWLDAQEAGQAGIDVDAKAEQAVEQHKKTLKFLRDQYDLQLEINTQRQKEDPFLTMEDLTASLKAAHDEYTQSVKAENDLFKNQMLYLEGIASIQENINEKRKAYNHTATVGLWKAEEALKKQKEQFELLKLQASGGVFDGMKAGLLSFAYETQSVFEGIQSTINQGINQLASAISDTLVDAFDPSKDVDLKQRFGKFLQSIAKMAIQTFMRIAIAKTIAFAFDGGASSSLIGNVSGYSPTFRARGGMIPRHAQASLAHYMAPQGLAGGGRPSGLPPTDTVPIWASPGEFMMRVDAVRRYGADVMAKINAGLVDPIGLRSLAGPLSAIKRRQRGPGFAAGGEVPVSKQVPTQTVQGSGGVSKAILVANDEAADMLLNGGRAAVLRFLAENRDDVNGALA